MSKIKIIGIPEKGYVEIKFTGPEAKGMPVQEIVLPVEMLAAHGYPTEDLRVGKTISPRRH